MAPGAMETLSRVSAGDLRRAITTLQSAVRLQVCSRARLTCGCSSARFSLAHLSAGRQDHRQPAMHVQAEYDSHHALHQCQGACQQAPLGRLSVAGALLGSKGIRTASADCSCCMNTVTSLLHHQALPCGWPHLINQVLSVQIYSCTLLCGCRGRR